MCLCELSCKHGSQAWLERLRLTCSTYGIVMMHMMVAQICFAATCSPAWVVVRKLQLAWVLHLVHFVIDHDPSCRETMIKTNCNPVHVCSDVTFNASFCNLLRMDLFQFLCR